MEDIDLIPENRRAQRSNLRPLYALATLSLALSMVAIGLVAVKPYQGARKIRI